MFWQSELFFFNISTRLGVLDNKKCSRLKEEQIPFCVCAQAQTVVYHIDSLFRDLKGSHVVPVCTYLAFYSLWKRWSKW